MMETHDTSDAAGVPELIELGELVASGEPGGLLARNLDVVQKLTATLTVVAGTSIVTIGDLMQLRAHQVLKLDGGLDEPIDILLEGTLVARGQLVAVDDHFGVRILELPERSTP